MSKPISYNEIPSQPEEYDVSPLTSDDDSEVDNDLSPNHHGRNSAEIGGHDHDLLREEEEREELLSQTTTQRSSKGFFERKPKQTKPGQDEGSTSIKLHKSRKKRKHKRKSGHDEEGELMYEMEEGGPKSETSSQASSSSVELNRMSSHGPVSKRRKFALCHVVAISIAALFALLTFGAYKVTPGSEPSPLASLRFNGTSTFAPTTVLISLDGFRADFLRRGITPTLNQFIAEGVSPKYMLPSFPSLTFPNHYTLVTGLHPESHGIVGNTFWAPDMHEDFHTDKGSLEQKWWTGAEPIWATAGKQKVKTATHMWPGSEAGMDFSPTYVDKFNMSETLPRKTARILELLDLPGEGIDPSSQRPQFIAAYVPVVDSDGHTYGPNSTEIWDTISDVDVMLHNLFRGLDERNLTEIVNVIVVSDHGMATTSTDRCIQLDDLIDLDLVEHIDGWPLYGLRPKDPIDIRGLYDRLLVESQSSGNFDVYLRDENMPAKYHFSNNDRIAPLWAIPKAGYAIVHKEDFDVSVAKANGETYHPKGLHGYDHEHPLMRAIFVARGPAFPHKPNSRLASFQNTEVYNIVCDSIGLQPQSNNGTLRLPLKPVGMHSEKPTSDEDDPTDFDPDKSPSKPGDTDESLAVLDKPHQPSPMNDTITITEADPVLGKEKETKIEMNKFWAYVKGKMAAAQAWAKQMLASLKGNHKKSGDQSQSFEQGENPE